MPFRSSMPALESRPHLLALLAIALLMSLPGRAGATLCCNTTTFICTVQTGGSCAGGSVAVSGTTCEPNSCTPQWSLGTWGVCSVQCGGGTQSRTVVCTIGTTIVTDSVCSAGGAGTKPATSQACNTGPCPAWSAGAWSACSTTCGPGTQTRTVVCMVGSTIVADSQCSSAGPKPATSQACNNGSCPVWSTGPWSACSTTCGPGTQTRTVVCMVDTTVVADIQCSSAGPKPATSQACTNGPCPAACCNRCTGGCLVLSPADCATFGGAFVAGSAACLPATCTMCPADFNGVNGVTIDDLFLYINAYFVGC